MGEISPARRTVSDSAPAITDWYPRDTGPNALGVYRGEGSSPSLPARLIAEDSPYGAEYGCMVFGDGLVAQSYFALRDNGVLEMAAGSHTMEGWSWIAQGDLGTDMSIFSGGLDASHRWFAPMTLGGKLRSIFFTAGPTDFDLVSSTSIPGSEWFKWSVTLNRTAGKAYLHLNGVKEAEAVLSGTVTNFATGRYLGHNGGNGGGLPFKGKCAGLRLSNVARYSAANYTPEMTPFESDGSTIALVQGSPT